MKNSSARNGNIRLKLMTLHRVSSASALTPREPSSRVAAIKYHTDDKVLNAAWKWLLHVLRDFFLNGTENLASFYETFGNFVEK